MVNEMARWKLNLGIQSADGRALGHNGTKIGPKAFTIYHSPFTIYNSPGDLGLRSVTPTTVTFWDCT
ncbi:MAG: hypothetical protein KJ638_09225, partial [Chloroflexi bacterium]|nr:hypothetical protein [Chloroflexota bacterium]